MRYAVSVLALVFALAGTLRSQSLPPLTSIDVTVPNSAANIQLAGSLTIPDREKKHPAVLLISGSGPQDRNETTAGHHTFYIVAEVLTRLGFVVLRLDDRGTGQSTGKFESATTEDFASDAAAEVEFLRQRPEVDPARVGLLGHGEGAIVAAMLAAKDPRIAFLILLSAPAVPGKDILLEQTARAEAASGIPEEQIEADHNIGEQLYTLAAQGRSQSDMRAALDKFSKKVPKPVLENWQRQIPRFSSPWLRFFLSYNPATAFEHVTCPVLAMYAENDLQVITDQNAPELEHALKKAHNKQVTILTLPGLNYLYQPSQTGLAWEYGKIRETMSPVPLQAISGWVRKTLKTDPL